MAHSTEKSARFKRENYFPQDWSSITAEFLALFHRYAYICKPLAGGDWFSANEAWALTDSEILKAIAGVHPKLIIGCRPGRSTKYAVLDIDTGSKYHNVPSVDALRSLLKQAGIDQTMVYRSSDSDGWHLYIFFEEAISSKDLSSQLNQLLKLNNFEIKKGTLEIFPQPGTGSNGQGLRLPMQQGFAWLDQKTLEVENERFEYSAVQALELFIDALTGAANTRHQFHQMKAFVSELSSRQCQDSKPELETIFVDNVVPLRKNASGTDAFAHLDIRRAFQVIPPGIIAESWLKGKDYYASGLTGPSQRAEAILCLGHYLFYGDPECQLLALGYGFEQERKQLIEAILSEKHFGNSRDLNRDRADALKQVERATAWVPPSRRGVNHTQDKFEMPVSWVRHNANLKLDARSRIKAAVDAFVAEEQSFSSRDLRDKAGCSRTTLYKHQDLWKDAYEQLRNRFFASGPHEYNAVGQPVSLETLPLLSTIEEGSVDFNAFFDVSGEELDELAYRRSAKVVQTWIRPVLDLLPKDLNLVDSTHLLFLIPTFNWFLSTSPTIACKSWLVQRLHTVRDELERRYLDFCLVGDDRLSRFKKDISIRYLGLSMKQGLPFARRLCGDRFAGVMSKHPPPT